MFIKKLRTDKSVNISAVFFVQNLILFLVLHVVSKACTARSV
jgi:hypothetical protein